MRSPPRRLQAAILLTGSLVAISLFVQQQWSPRSSIVNHPYFGYDVASKEIQNPDQTCVLPKIHPFDPSIWAYLTEPRFINCGDRHLALTYINDTGYLKFNDTQLAASDYTITSLHCTWSPIQRQDDDHVTFGNPQELRLEGVYIQQEIISVSCKNFAGFTVYSSLHAHIRDVSLHRPMTSTSQRSQAYNVVIFGLDSLSRLSFIRLLPNTYRYLTEVMGTFVFRGMNKVADNTFPNLVALLTGKAAYGSDLPSEKGGYDEWPLIWRNYSASGYVTLWAEDFPDFGLFNYLSSGFKSPPTHHYLRPFWLAVRDSSLLRMSSHMCFGSTPKHRLQMEYVRRFITKYNRTETPYFGFSFLAELSHEYLAQVAVADQDFLQFFRDLFESGHLSRTILIVMSDHGHRFDPMRETQQGRIEERLPFFGLYVPPSLLAEQAHIVSRLTLNTGRLVTHYDTHSTLVDLLKHFSEGSLLGSLSTETSFGRTLFGMIPADRSCGDAGIPTHYCTCETEVSLPPEDVRGTIAARALIHHINTLLDTGSERTPCAPLRLGVLKSVHIVKLSTEATGFLETVPEIHPSPKTLKQRIRVVILAEPSKGLFEATVQVGDGENNVHILGDVSRINKYGNQSSCIRHDILRKYCFCL